MDLLKLLLEFIKIIPNKFIDSMLARNSRKRDICAYIVNRIYVSGRLEDISFRAICDSLGIENIYELKNEFRMISLSDELCNYICDEKTNIPIDEKRKLFDFVQKEKRRIDKLVDVYPYSATERYLYRNKRSIAALTLFMTIIYLMLTYDQNVPLLISGVIAVTVLVPGAIGVSLATDMLFSKDDADWQRPVPVAQLFNFLYDRFSIFKKFFNHYEK
ncbi:hypothetical protein [Selenomonas ruminantium]|uniref:hypothetical protein n=1 Tax=Selenomonas ruminantium TaxID=971 RepID=UPI000479C1B0|nr:hypothetical protein [Selenomonas ruminantium]